MNTKNIISRENLLDFLQKKHNVTNVKSLIHKETLSNFINRNSELAKIPKSNLFIFRPEYFVIYQNQNKLESIIINFSESSISLKDISYAQLQSKISNCSKSIYISTNGLSHDLYNVLFTNPRLKDNLLTYNCKKIELFRFNLNDFSFYEEEY
jgi:hypothetical protein